MAGRTKRRGKWGSGWPNTVRADDWKEPGKSNARRIPENSPICRFGVRAAIFLTNAIYQLLACMFDSVEGGIVPVCLLTAAVAFGFSYLRFTVTALLASIAAAVAIGYGWFWIPQLINSQQGGDSLRPWDLIATSIWSMFAVPVAIAVVLIARHLRAKGKHAS